jgi:release factor glutamine methyltransferase
MKIINANSPSKLAEVLAFSNQELKNAGINSYRLDSLILLCHYLNLPKEQILFGNLNLNQNQLADFLCLIERRIKREPVSHITGKREFFGNEFAINSFALDPRPDSETLIEAAQSHFDKESFLEILELGVGSGCLILTLLKFFVNSRGLAIDINEEALKVAIHNSERFNLQNRCQFFLSNWFENVDKKLKFDLIISNPPYIPTHDIANLQNEVKDYEPLIALDGGKDGLECYRQIALNAEKFLKKNGMLILEIGQNQENEVTKLFKENGLNFIESKKDLAGIIRCLIFKKPA